MDRLDAMTLFVAAVDEGSLSAAARRSGVPLATVSRKVSDLEAHLKTRLLNRATRGLSLTDAGRDYYAACKRILDEVGEAERAASGEYSAPKGDLVVTAPVVFGRIHMLPIVAEFLQAHPDVNVRLVLADRVINLHEERVDVALRISALPDSSLLAKRVGEIRRVICASPSYLDARGVPLEPQDLARHECITFETLAAPATWVFGDRERPLLVPVRSRLVTTTAEPAVDAATLGIGIARVLSYQVAAAVRNGALRLILEGFEPPPVPVSLVYSGGGRIPLKLRAFLDFATPRLKARLSGFAAPVSP
ncbi:LysR family transcriptional regulator [Inquilinus sp. OTU3971]|uniref:LysR family transcriptional regulator n=1 Tax=Inquilinus sp. OTU3971 TaxID=3043855 RepID=UPI00313BAE66